MTYLAQNLDHLHSIAGVREAAVFTVDAGALTFQAHRGDPSRVPLLRRCAEVLQDSGEPAARVVLQNVAICIERHADDVLVVAVELGHPSLKSLRRTVRRLAARAVVRRTEHPSALNTPLP